MKRKRRMPSVLATCSRCQSQKSEHRVFSRGGSRGTGIYSVCRTCETTLQTERGQRDPLTTRAYRAWTHLRDRVRNHDLYSKLDVEAAWDAERDGTFEAFLAHVGLPPSAKHTIDRIDGGLGYIVGNVRWATIKQQARNKRINRWIKFRGRTMVLEDWAEEVGISSGTIWGRLAWSWSVKDALTTPPRTRRKRR